ncbi:glucosaminidase domain-containing protein [Aestuariibacter salexigens]|uniref:glucosaminidase domain-containing protein n=1 Tax=Aestuariibacter salexigens TaxID=226010 RepID=UPI0003F70A3B|nr:glucosaminidase domain-containing protein [Aestuariibacter salexigens]
MLNGRLRTSKVFIGSILFIGGLALIYPFLKKQIIEEPELVKQKPVAAIPDFASFSDVTERKKAFFNYLAPAVKAENERILRDRHFLLDMQLKLKSGEELSSQQQDTIFALSEDYRIDEALMIDKKVEALLERVDVVPLALVLIQAANESGWGQSRFARQGYNFFGLWCFSEGCGFVPRRRGQGASHEVAKFDSLEQAVHRYILNLNRHPAYEELRSIRRSLRQQQLHPSAKALSEGLLRYSERGEDYVEELQDMIDVNRELIPQ